MNNEISSLSAIFTVVAILFGLWHTEIKNATELKLPIHDEDKKSKKSIIRNIRNTKGIPLLIINILMGLIFIPDGISVIYNSINLLCSDTQWVYDSSKTAFIAIIILSISLDILLISDIIKLNKKLKE